MTTDLAPISPEGFDIANAYLYYGSIKDTATQLDIPVHTVVSVIQRPEVKRYLDGVYLDMGYRNRSAIGSALDKMIEAKLEEAEETGIYTKEDLLKLLEFAHKMRMDEIKATGPNIPHTAVQINHSGDSHFGDTGYGKLMEKLIATN